MLVLIASSQPGSERVCPAEKAGLGGCRKDGRNGRGAASQRRVLRACSGARTGVTEQALVARKVAPDRAHHDHGHDAGHDDHHHEAVQDAEPAGHAQGRRSDPGGRLRLGLAHARANPPDCALPRLCRRARHTRMRLPASQHRPHAAVTAPLLAPSHPCWACPGRHAQPATRRGRGGNARAAPVHASAGHAQVGVPPGGPGDVAQLPVHIVRVHQLAACAGHHVSMPGVTAIRNT